MGKINFEKCYNDKGLEFKGLQIITPCVYDDSRGEFFESYNDKHYIFDKEFVQDNISISNKNVMRGLHFQNKKPQAKLVECLNGTIIDFVVDLRNDSQTFGEYFKVELSDKNHKQLYIPRGFAHGFITFTDNTVFHYKCDDYYDFNSCDGLCFYDETLNIDLGEFEDINNRIIKLEDLHYLPFDKNKKYFDINGIWLN